MTTPQLYTVTRTVTTYTVVLAESEEHAKRLVSRGTCPDPELPERHGQFTASPFEGFPRGWTPEDSPWIDIESRPKVNYTIEQHIVLGHAPEHERAVRRDKAQIEAMRRDMYGEDGDD